MSNRIPKVDLFEASVQTRPDDVRVGDLVPVSWSVAHTVVGIEPHADGVALTLRRPSGTSYPHLLRHGRVIRVVRP